MILYYEKASKGTWDPTIDPEMEGISGARFPILY
jgi:hypothetical protein